MSKIILPTYEIEDKYLSPYAQKSLESKGRIKPVKACDMRTEFQRDRDRIIHCKSFRRLKHKTQVFLSPEGDHYRTRLTHTLEVSQIARSLARALRMNEDLTEAISLGHDIGHTPFGHAGERALNDMMGARGFRHNEQSLRVVDVLEYEGKGMNLTHEVRDGILNHTRKGNPATLEGRIVCLSDQIAYLNHDIDDAVRGGVLTLDDIPKSVEKTFGRNHGERINGMIMDIIENSYGKDIVAMSPPAKNETETLRNFMFENVYRSGQGKGKEEEPKVDGIIKSLFNHFLKNMDGVPEYIRKLDAPDEQKVCDYISTMSDTFVVKIYEDIFVPKRWTMY